MSFTWARVGQYSERVSSDPRDQPTQQTEQGLEIPIPDRKDVMDAFRKVAHRGSTNGRNDEAREAPSEST